jgi:perosamine synthetase
MKELPSVDEMSVQANATLQDAMMTIDNNAQGACFVLEDKLLVGVLTDGDIRRALLTGVQVAASVTEAMNRDFISMGVNTPLEKIQSLLAKSRHVPITDAEGKLVDYACASRYHQVALTQPILDGNELEYVTDCIRTGWISSQGKYVRQFEENFGKYVGNPHTLAVSNGTVALHLALVTLGVGPGDEVLVPDLTFVAPVNAVLYVGATPVMVDVDPNSLAINMDAAERAITSKTRAIIPVHLYGHPADMGRAIELAKKHSLLVIEDCAEAIGSHYHGRHVGSLGDAAIFSFFGNKTLTTGEGGMLLFNHMEKLERSRVLRDHGMSRERRYWHDQVGYNYRLTNIQAALGVAQLERVDRFVAQKRWIAEEYSRHLSEVEGLQLPGEFGDVVNSYWLYTVILPTELSLQRDQILNSLAMNGVEARRVFYPIHRMPPYAKYTPVEKSFPVSSLAADSGISLPSSVNITASDIERVSCVFKKIIKKYEL